MGKVKVLKMKEYICAEINSLSAIGKRRDRFYDRSVKILKSKLIF